MCVPEDAKRSVLVCDSQYAPSTHPHPDVPHSLLFEIEQQARGCPDAVQRSAVARHRVVELNPDRVVPLGVARGTQAKPDVVRRVRRRGERHVEVVGRRREGNAGAREAGFAARHHLSARAGSARRQRPVPGDRRYVRRIRHDIVSRPCPLRDHRQRYRHAHAHHCSSHRADSSQVENGRDFWDW